MDVEKYLGVIKANERPSSWIAEGYLQPTRARRFVQKKEPRGSVLSVSFLRNLYNAFSEIDPDLGAKIWSVKDGPRILPLNYGQTAVTDFSDVDALYAGDVGDDYALAFNLHKLGDSELTYEQSKGFFGLSRIVPGRAEDFHDLRAHLRGDFRVFNLISMVRQDNAAGRLREALQGDRNHWLYPSLVNRPDKMHLRRDYLRNGVLVTGEGVSILDSNQVNEPIRVVSQFQWKD